MTENNKDSTAGVPGLQTVKYLRMPGITHVNDRPPIQKIFKSD